MNGFYEHGIMWSPWLDPMKLIGIKSGFNFVWEKESFSGINSPLRYISSRLKLEF